MPMQLANRSLLQVLLRGGDVVTCRQVRDDLLTDPASSKNSRLRVREAPLEIRDYAIVGALSTKVVRVLQVDLLVRAA